MKNGPDVDGAGADAEGTIVPDGFVDPQPTITIAIAIAMRPRRPLCVRRSGVARGSGCIGGIVARGMPARRWAGSRGFHVAFLMAFPVVVEPALGSVHLGPNP